jgi:glutamyl-tRNA reductase
VGRKTSVYLADELDAAVKASGVPLGEIVRRGLNERAPEEAAALAAATAVRDEIQASLEHLAERAVSRAVDEMQAAVGEAADRAVKSALRDAQGGSW